MSLYKVDFESMPWQPIRPDVRQKVFCEGARQIRLVEFDTSDGAQDWCDVGHIGYVLRGSLSISFDGEVLDFAAGDGLFIPSGTQHRHRSVSIAAGTQLLMVEEL